MHNIQPPGAAPNSSELGSRRPPLPDRKHFRHVFVPSVNFPLFITSASLVLIPSWDFFYTSTTAQHIDQIPSDSLPVFDAVNAALTDV